MLIAEEYLGGNSKPHGPFTSTAAIFGVEVELNQMCAGMR